MSVGKCNGCGAEWSATLVAHCGNCHSSFTGISAFDKHRHYGKCHDPASRGLVLSNRSYECWGLSGEPDYNEMFRRRDT